MLLIARPFIHPLQLVAPGSRGSSLRRLPSGLLQQQACSALPWAVATSPQCNSPAPNRLAPIWPAAATGWIPPGLLQQQALGFMHAHWALADWLLSSGQRRANTHMRVTRHGGARSDSHLPARTARALPLALGSLPALRGGARVGLSRSLSSRPSPQWLPHMAAAQTQHTWLQPTHTARRWRRMVRRACPAQTIRCACKQPLARDVRLSNSSAP